MAGRPLPTPSIRKAPGVANRPPGRTTQMGRPPPQCDVHAPIGYPAGQTTFSHGFWKWGWQMPSHGGGGGGMQSMPALLSQTHMPSKQA